MKPTSSHVPSGRSSIWQADIVSVVALVVFVLVVYGLERWVQPVFTPNTLLFTGIVLALIPAGIWLAFFYRRDRLEPEPKALVLQVFILGGLLASAIGIPFLEGFFEISTWLYRNTWSHLLGAILVIGVSQEFLKYAAVRFSVFGSAEFDEPIDGIVYATASGLGFATVLNIAFVVNSGGVDLGAGVIRMTVIALAHASFAGVVGYYLGLEKFEKRPVWSTAVGLALAALLNGIFFFLRNTITQGSINASGGYAQSWNGLILAAILAAIITWGLSVALKKHASAELAAEEG